MEIDLQNDREIFAVVVDDLQDEAIDRIGRKLTEDELHTAKKCVGFGLSSCLDITLRAAIDEAVRQNHDQRTHIKKTFIP